MPLLTREDVRRQSAFAWICILALLAMAAWFWDLEKRNAAMGTLLALLGCLGLILPPRERMEVLPHRIRALPRRVDAAPILATLISSPGYGLNWFYGVNPYDEIVHLLSGFLAGMVFVALLQADGRPRERAGLVLAASGFGLALGAGWEVFEWATDLIGDWTDTWTDVLLTGAGATIAGAVARRSVPPR
ncbi:DUF2238 domain-containing protein [Roseomonas sp. SSH11]|uniref:DUF2238 domain-containing protein n=1 Tax=Pararoseomonas baculiformis TaxID=2820812 RepID=A0ABS4AG82_9PROT|nr:DUF2238 domain-containing protein [Pararoseomonas baculiformis]MBP0446040.1 DUF2238 domain-containing protein [Pararoseomonas baculiformis]